jgi:hypothetical protein
MSRSGEVRRRVRMIEPTNPRGTKGQGRDKKKRHACDRWALDKRLPMFFFCSHGFRRYRGPVTTLEQASLADFPVSIRCETCGHIRQMHAYQLIKKLSKKIDPAKLYLDRPIEGFWCRAGRHKTAVIIRAPLQSSY